MPTPRVHQELLAVGRDREAEVIRDTFVPAEKSCHSKDRGEIDAEPPLLRGSARRLQLCDICHGSILVLLRDGAAAAWRKSGTALEAKGIADAR